MDVYKNFRRKLTATMLLFMYDTRNARNIVNNPIPAAAIHK